MKSDNKTHNASLVRAVRRINVRLATTPPTF